MYLHTLSCLDFLTELPITQVLGPKLLYLSCHVINILVINFNGFMQILSNNFQNKIRCNSLEFKLILRSNLLFQARVDLQKVCLF